MISRLRACTQYNGLEELRLDILLGPCEALPTCSRYDLVEGPIQHLGSPGWPCRMPDVSGERTARLAVVAPLQHHIRRAENVTGIVKSETHTMTSRALAIGNAAKELGSRADVGRAYSGQLLAPGARRDD